MQRWRRNEPTTSPREAEGEEVYSMLRNSKAYLMLKVGRHYTDPINEPVCPISQCIHLLFVTGHTIVILHQFINKSASNMTTF